MAYGNAASAESAITPKKVILKVNNTGMFVDEATTSTLLDPQLYATPEIRNNRVMIPITSVTPLLLLHLRDAHSFGITLIWGGKN